MDELRTVKTIDINGLCGKKAVVFFEQTFTEDWGYMGMRDYRTYEPTDEYRISVVHYNSNGHANSTDAGYLLNSFKSKYFNKDMANKIWYNLKNGMDYTSLLRTLRKMDLVWEV